MKFPSRHTLYGLSSSVAGCNHIFTISHHQQPPLAINHHPQPSLFSADSHRHSSSTSIVSHHPQPSTISHIRHQSSPATIIGHHLQPSSTPPTVPTAISHHPQSCVRALRLFISRHNWPRSTRRRRAQSLLLGRGSAFSTVILHNCHLIACSPTEATLTDMDTH